jgi:hypothetical protein
MLSVAPMHLKLNVAMLNVVMLSFVMVSAVMLNAVTQSGVMLSVMAQLYSLAVPN